MARRADPARNAAIVSDWKSGMATAEVAAKYGLTGARIIQIVTPHTTRDERRKRNADATKANWQDPEFRKRNADAVKANWQDPEFRKRQADAVKANWQDPEFRRTHHLKFAKKCVRKAGLPLLKSNVERAKVMLDAGERMEVVIDALVQESREAA